MAGIVSDIKTMKIRSARTVTLASLKYLRSFANKNGFGRRFHEKIMQLEKARPTTTVMLMNALAVVKKEPSINKINTLIREIGSFQEKINKNASIIRGRVMIHCNSTELDKALIANKSRIREVFVTSTEPRQQGLLSAKELAGGGVRIKFIIDSAIGYYMQDADMVAVGADVLTEKGVVNKIGTLLMAVAADAFHKPFYVVANTMKYHKSVKIEFRNPNEVTKKLPNSVILNPAFDITPWRYVTAVITEEGVKKPIEILRELKK